MIRLALVLILLAAPVQSAPIEPAQVEVCRLCGAACCVVNHRLEYLLEVARGGIGTFRVGSYRRERTMTFDLAKARKLAETAVILKNEFMKTANWRREQAIDYPDDRWNFEAVVLLERLANTVDEIDPRLLEAYVGLWEGDGLSGAVTHGTRPLTSAPANI